MKQGYIPLMLLLLIAAPAVAQKPPPEPAAETKPQANEQKLRSQPGKPVRPGKREFLPSEEISADSAVSFPVDI